MRKPPFFHTVPSTARLQPDPGVPARIRKAAAALRALPREALTPSEAWIEDNAAPLLREASARIREARQLPPLPALSGVPRALLLARKICAADGGEIDEGLVLRAARENADGAEYRWDEMNALGCALAAALLEQLEEPLSRCLAAPLLDKRAEKWAQDFSAEKRADLPEDGAHLLLTFNV